MDKAKMIMVFKSGRECHFECDNYSLIKTKDGNEIYEFSYKGGIGECPIFYRGQDIESIIRIA